MKQPRTWLAGLMDEAHDRRNVLYFDATRKHPDLTQGEVNAKIDELTWLINRLTAKYNEETV